MLKILLFIVILCAAIFAGPFLADQQGFVHIATSDYVIETSLTTAIILAIVAFIVLYFVVSLVLKFVHLPQGTQSFLHRRQVKKKTSLQQEAVLAYEEGDFERALALIRRAGSRKNTPLESCFIGAKAAFALQDYELCSQFLDEAKKRSKQAFISSSIIRAKFNLKIGNAKAALEVLNELKRSYSSKLVTKLTFECWRKEEDHEQIAAMMPKLLRQNILSKDEAEHFLHEELLEHIDKAQSSGDVQAVLSALDKKTRRDPKLVGRVTKRLLELSDINTARKLSLEQLKKKLDPDFLEYVAQWDTSIPEVLTQLKKQAERNLIESEVNLPLLKAIGNLEFKAGQLKEAQGHLEKALQLASSPDICLKLAQVMAAQRLYEPASAYYAQALNAQPLLPHR